MSGLWQTVADILQNRPVLGGLLILGAGSVVSGLYCGLNVAWDYMGIRKLNAEKPEKQDNARHEKSGMISQEEYSEACLDNYHNY